jgi:hypothetical protein
MRFHSAGVIAIVLCGLPVAAQDIASTFSAISVSVALAVSHQPANQPFTVEQRWAYYLHRTYSPHRLGLLALETGIDHALRQPACWDRGASSYVTRYSRALDRRMIRNTAELGAGLLTGLDIRYRPLGSGPVRTRIWNAARGAFVARTAAGTERLAYTRFTASAVAEVATAHWTGQPLGAGWLAQAVASGALDQIQTNLLDEFGPDFRRIGARMSKRLRHGLGVITELFPY